VVIVTFRHDQQTEATYIINPADGTQQRCLSNGSNIKKFRQGITGFASAVRRKELVGKDLGVAVLKQNNNNYIPQPTKFEGYSNFPRPMSRPYVNKISFFKSNVMKIPKPLVKDKFMNTHNDFVFKTDEGFRHNNVGLSYMTGQFSSMSQSQNARATVLTDFRNSKILKSKMKKNDKSLSKVVQLQEALEKNEMGGTIHGRMLRKPALISRTSYRSSSVRIPVESNKKNKKNNMSMTSYTTGFGAKSNLGGKRSMYNTTQKQSDGRNLNTHSNMDKTNMFSIRSSYLVGPKSTKYGPDKVRPFLDYDFTSYGKPEPEPKEGKS